MDFSLLYFIALILITLFLYMLPFIPAWYEWKYKTDAEPFRVHLQDRTIVDYNIRIFKEYITNHFAEVLNNYNPAGLSFQHPQSGGIGYYIIGNGEALELRGNEALTRETAKVILFLGKGVLPEYAHFKNKVYCSESLYTGLANRLNEVYSEKDILLAANTKVQKLVYARGELIVEDKVILNCYTRAGEKIGFLGSAKFQYLHAKLIEFEPAKGMSFIESIDVIGANLPRIIKENDYILPAHSEVESHFLVKAPLFIQEHCRVIGNIKSSQDIKIEANTRIFGSIFSEKNIYISDNCFIQGPIVASQSIHIGHNCLIGSSDSMTSIVAPYIHIAKGCCTTGQILAKIEGSYLAC